MGLSSVVSSMKLQGLAACLLLMASGVAVAGDVDPRMGFVPPGRWDFSGDSWTGAFARAHRTLAAEYAFTEWKEVNWGELYRVHAPAIARAEAAKDKEALYLALHDYLFSVDDGHLNLPRTAASGQLADGLIRAQSGGSFGLGLAKLDDGRVIVAVLREAGPGERAGIELGAEITAWGGDPIDGAMSGVDLGQRAASARIATQAHRRLEQLRLLTRAPVGATAEVVFRNPAATAPRSVGLQAVDDDLKDINLLNLAPSPSDADEAGIISARMLKSDVGYIRLVAEADLSNLAIYPDAIRERFLSAVSGLRSSGARALVLDLRGNHGGFDTLSADLCAVFSETRSVFEKTVFFDKRDGGFLEFTYDDRVDDVVESIDVVPRPDGFRGPVAVLVNPRTISSGEGLAKCIADLPQGQSVGFNGTNGSFGIATGEIAMPAGIVIHYPNGRSVDANGTIQIDSRRGVGGVQPELRIAASLDNIMAHGRGEDVELREALRWIGEKVR